MPRWNLEGLVPWTPKHTHYATCIHCTNSLPSHWRVRLALMMWKGIELRAALIEHAVLKAHDKTPKA